MKLTSQDCFHVAGQYATAGYVEYLKRPIPTDNSALVNLLLDAGAVLYCKTNVPQTMMVSARHRSHSYALLIAPDRRLGE
jgi:amidase